MKIRHQPELAAAMIADARHRHPREACGLVFGRAEGASWRAIEYHPLTNRAPQPDRGFEFDPIELLEADALARSRGLSVLGTFHSHPSGDPLPSPDDDRVLTTAPTTWITAESTAGYRLAVWAVTPSAAVVAVRVEILGGAVPNRDR